MSSTARLLKTVLASLVIASVASPLPRCISCPCGSNNQTYTYCFDELLLKDFNCERWSRCETCEANSTVCLTCPPDRYGPTCSEDCGRSFFLPTDRITNGMGTPAGQWPWTVGIAEANTADTTISCGGALIDKNTVLTAAHCLTNDTDFVLYFGKHNRSDEHDDSEVQIRISCGFVLHPEFNNVAYDNDIAIVKFEPEIQYSERIQPVCLPTRTTTAKNVLPFKKGYVSGWGLNEHNVHSQQLMTAQLSLQTDRTCLSAYKKKGIDLQLNAGKVCAGHPQGFTNACAGDSGSPMVFYEIETHRHILEGIVSFGMTGDCTGAEMYTVFAKVSNFQEWILRNIRS